MTLTRPATRGARRLAATVVTAVLLVSQMVSIGAVHANESDWTRFTVYFPMYLQSGAYVHPVDFIVPLTDEPIEAALNALIAGVPGSHSMVALPGDAGVLDVSVQDGVATVDFSQEMQTGLNVGSGGEAAVIMAIANTVCSFQGVTAVKILIDGQPVETLAGHVDVTGPIGPNWDGVFRPMDDVAQHWSGGAVLILQSLDIIAGYEDSTFRPENQVTRAEFVKMLVEAIGATPEGPAQLPFEDMASHWASPYVRRALGAGLIEETDYGVNFGPDQVIPRDEMAYILVKASDVYRAGHPGFDFAPDLPAITFTDEAVIQPQYLDAAIESAKRGLINGYPDGSFGPANGLKRSEAATVIARMMEVKGDKVFLRHPRPGFDWDGGDLFVLGSASAFEANVNFRVLAADHSEIMLSHATATYGMGWGAFGFCVDSEILAGEDASSLEVFLMSMEDGSDMSKIVVPLQ